MGKAILSTTTENLVTPAPPTPPDKGSIREIATGEITLPITPDDPSWRPLFAEKLESFRGLRPLGPRQGLCPSHPPARGPYGGPLDPHPYEALSRARCAMRTDFSAHPFFCKSWIRHCTHPPLLVQVACPQRRRSWGSWGAVAAPHENIGGGGQTYRFAPPPPQ